MNLPFRLSLLLIIFVAALLPAAARADVSDKDFQVLVRAFGFVDPAPSGNVNLAVIYDPANSNSFAEAKQLAARLTGGYKAGAMTLYPKLVSATALEGMEGARFAFVANGTSAYHSVIAKMAHAHKVLTATLDRSCVETGDCVLYVNTANRVEIVVNKQSAAASEIIFKPTFMVLVTTL